jgi:hypothetical protein
LALLATGNVQELKDVGIKLVSLPRRRIVAIQMAMVIGDGDCPP